MTKKKQLGGLSQDPSIIQPGDEQIIDDNNLVSTLPQREVPKTSIGTSKKVPGMGSYLRQIANPVTGGPTLYNKDLDKYTKYIDRPFSLSEENIDDVRAQGQGVGEKLWRAYGVKMPVNILTNVIGSTAGLVVGAGETVNDLFTNGPAWSNFNKFFNNDFQHSLDDINEGLSEKLPHYYTQAEREMGAFKAAFGPGAANFWTDQFASGLSFVAGAVLSEFATAGLASAIIPARTANYLKRISSLRQKAYGQKSASGLKALQKIDRAERVWNGLTQMRRIATGAFYESGVEARHNYDQTVENLVRLHTEKYGTAPTEKELLDIKDIAIKTSNAVFATNAALVGYSNYMMFPTIFGKGMRMSQKSFAKDLVKDAKGMWVPKYKQHGKWRKFGATAWNILKRPAYEGFVEEGGQKLADISGQQAAEYYYTNGKNPGQMQAIGGLLDHTHSSFAEAYGGAEGQREIFLGFILGGLGLPSFVRTNEETGKKEYSLFNRPVGGVWDSVRERSQKRETLNDLANYLNENPDAVTAIQTNFDMLTEQANANDERDFAMATNNDYAYKNADHDAFFSYIYHRLKAGYFSDAVQSIEDIRNMDLDTFEEQFNYTEETANMTEKERTEFLTDRKNKVADTHINRANKIKELWDTTHSLRVGEKGRKLIMHAYSTAEDRDERESKLETELQEEYGMDLSIEKEQREENDKNENDSLFTRIKNFTLDKLGLKAIEVMEESTIGKMIKKQLGIREFTEPGHPMIVLQELAKTIKLKQEQADQLEKEGKDDAALELLYEIDKLQEQFITLQQGVRDATAPDISSEEQQLLDDLKAKDPATYEKNKDDIIKKLQDLRHLRANRHRALNLVQQLIDPDAVNDKIQKLENYINDIAQDEKYKNLDKDQKRMLKRYQGKVIEFDYTDKNGVTRTHRVLYKEHSDEGLIKIPDAETFKLMKRLDLLNSLEKTRGLSPDEAAEKQLIEEELEGKVTEYDTFNTGILDKATNIKIIDNQARQLEDLQLAIDVLTEQLSTQLEEANKMVYETKFKLLELGEDILEIKKALQNAKNDKNGRLWVNLNKIGRRGRYGVQGANQVLAEILEIENTLKESLIKFKADIDILEERSLKMQVIHALMTNPEMVSDIMDRPATAEDAKVLINSFLGLIEEEKFFKDLLDKGYFDKNALLELAKTTGKDNITEVDKQILMDLLKMVVPGKENIPKEYLSMINEDLNAYENELNTLIQHRKDVQRLLSKMIDSNGEVKMFPPDGLTASDFEWLNKELMEIDGEIDLLESMINMMRAETEQSVMEDLVAVRDEIATMNEAYVYERAIMQTLNDYHNWLNMVLTEKETEVKDENTKNPDTRDTQESDQDIARINNSESSNTTFSVSLLDKGFNKTAGNHRAAMDQIAEYDQIMTERELSPSEKNHYAHLQSQMRFFKASEELTDWTKATGAKLMVVTRYNIPQNLEDKIIFFDHIRAKEDKKNKKFTDNFQLARNLKSNENRSQENENIKLVLVDNNLEPILIDGDIVYTDMPTSEVYKANGDYMYQKDKDLILDKDGNPEIDENTGLPKVKAGIQELVDLHSTTRQALLQTNKPQYYLISGKGKGLPIWEDNNPDARGTVLGRLVNKMEELKDVQLQAAIGTAGEERAILSIGGNQWNVKNGQLFFGTKSGGFKGNLVPAQLDILGEATQNNIYNLIRLWATRQDLVNQAKMDPAEAADIGGKGITTILKEMIFFGKQAKNRQLKEFAIWMEKDAIWFGNKGDNITIEELIDPAKYADKHAEFKTFLSTLKYDVNATRLNEDSKARAQARSDKSNAIKKAKGEKAKRAAARRTFEPEYSAFVEVQVADDLSINTITWNNYTEYLISGNNRVLADIPVKVNMNKDYSGSKNVKQASVPQFMNIYITHKGTPVSRNDIINSSENQKEAIKKEQSDAKVTVNEQGDVEGTYTSKTQEEVEKDLEDRSTPKTFDVIDPSTGEKVGEVTARTTEGTTEESEIMKGNKLPSPLSEEEIKERQQQGKDAAEEAGFKTDHNPDEYTEEEEDEPYLLKTTANLENPSVINLDSQLLWFDRVMPKDAFGNPIIALDIVRGLIDGKAFGKFTKDGNILISSEMDVDGVVYHEAWHGITRRLIPAEDRFRMYDEVRKMRGKARTFKGEVKNLSEFTDKEADEFLAEEFRAYVIADGNYTVGQNVKKSWIDKLFDKIFEILNLFVNNQSQAQLLMSKIHGGYFSNPTTNITIYDSNTEAYMEVGKPSATLINNTMEGLTVSLFNIASEQGLFEMEDFFDISKQGKLTAQIKDLYGSPATYIKGEEKVINKIIRSLDSSKRKILQKQLVAVSPTQQNFLNAELLKIRETKRQILNNWDMLIREHESFLDRFNIDLQAEEINEFDKTGKGFDIPQHEIDPNLLLPHPVRLLIATLPATEMIAGKRSFTYNSSGLPKLADFGSTMAFLYKELANTDPKNILENIRALQSKRPEIVSLVKRLGIESDDMSGKTLPQMRMVLRTMMQFDQAMNTFWTQKIDLQGGRYLLDSNSDRIDKLIKDVWTLNFKDTIDQKFGKLENGKMVIDSGSTVEVNGVSKTLDEWSKTPKKPEQALGILSAIGIRFSDNPYFMQEYDTRDEVKTAVNWILTELRTSSLSDLYEGDIHSRLRILLDIEKEITKFAIDLQHRTPEGKNAYGISLKTYIDTLVADLNGDPEQIQELLKYDNLNNSYWLQRMLSGASNLKVHVLQGIDQQFGKRKSLSHTNPVDIGIMHLNAILENGIIPIIRTADKKTEYGISLDKPTLSLTTEDMIARLQGYLLDEIKSAIKFNTNKDSKLKRIKTLQDQGGDLRFFKGIVPITKRQLNRKLTNAQIEKLVSSPEINAALKEFIDNKIAETKLDFQRLNIVRPSKQNTFLSVGVSNVLLSNLKMKTADPYDSATMSDKTFQLLAAQFVYEHTTGILEQSKLLLGDLALYTDLFKRTAGVSGTKIYPTSNPNVLNWMNDNMPNLGFKGREHSNIMRTVHRADVKVDSPYVQQYIDVLSTLNPSMIGIIQDTYNGMDEFDGGGFMHLDSYRSLLFRAGKWTDKQEALYQKIMTGEEITNEDLAFFPPLKPQTMAPFVVDNQRLMTFHKYALFPLIPQVHPGKAYEQINADMEANNVDYQVFDSVVKIGGITSSPEFETPDNKLGFDPFYEEDALGFKMYKPMSLDENNEPLGIQETNFSLTGIQVEVAPKIKDRVSQGTQLTSLLPVNIYNDGVLREDLKESGLDVAIDNFHEVNYTIISRDLNNLISRLGLERKSDGTFGLKNNSISQLRTAILEELNKRDIPRHTKRGIKILLNQPIKYINQLLEKNKIEGILYSIVTNSVIRQKMKGDLMVLQSSTGMEVTARALKQNDFERAKKEGVDLSQVGKQLEFYRKQDPNDPNSKTLGMQVALPHRFRELGLGNTIDINDSRIDPALRDLIGFRIPTEGLNSVDFIEVVEYLPPSAGSAIIVPSELVGKAGSDYDIDKLTVYFPHYSYDSELNTVTKISYLSDANSTVEERFEVMQQTEPQNTPETLREFSKLSIPEQNTKAALQNRAQDIIRDVLSNPLSFDQLITPTGAFQLKLIAKEIANKRGTDKAQGFGQILSFGNLVDQSYRMWSGLGGTGIVASSATQHSKAQRAGLNWAIPIELNFASEVPFGSLSRVYDVNTNIDDQGLPSRRVISSVLAEYISGYVDVTKDDFVFDINAGVNYAPVHMMLLRSGVPLKQVLYFMSQPIIDEYVKMKETQQGLAAQTSPGNLYQTERDVEIALRQRYGAPAENKVQFTENSLFEMIGMDIQNMPDMYKQFQAQIFEDFMRYKDYANELFLLNQGIKFDTGRLTSSMAVKYQQSVLKRVKDSGTFNNIDKIIFNEDGKFSLLSALKDAYDIAPKMFSTLDLKSNNTYIDQWMDYKMYQLTDPNLRISQDDAIYRMERFDSFLSSWIIQTTPTNGVRLSDRISQMFQGVDSLPRQILRAKNNPALSNNLLIKEFYPVLQTYNDPKHPEYNIDNLKLFSKKLQVYDIDLLSDAFMELKELDPALAKNIIEFSTLQSGLNFSPIAFFQILPAEEVLRVLSPYFTKNPVLDMDTLWYEFNQNSWKDPRITSRVRLRTTEAVKSDYRNGEVSTLSKEEFITISLPTGEIEKIGGLEKPVYDTKLFIKKGPNKNKKGFNIYQEIQKRGDGIYLQEIGKTNSVLKSNISKFGLKEVDIDSSVESTIEDNGSVVISRNNVIEGGHYLTPKQGRINLTVLGSVKIKDILTGTKKVKDLLGIKSKGKKALDELSILMGYENWIALKKANKNKQLVAGKNVILYKATSLETGTYSIKRERSDVEDSYGFDPSQQEGTEFLFKPTISLEIDKIKTEKDNCQGGGKKR